MASTETKLVSRIVLSVAVFISLSVSVSAENDRRCYWCGPLAEQVHRSRRAPPCSEANSHVTVCDSGFPYCAVVATSPPYIESRYCVKFYQDECYSLYCNSTKTWRMTCPCRGDLCNGPNTERENEAFSVLARLVAKTNNARIKRAFSSPGFINRKKRDELINGTSGAENDTVTVSVIVDPTQSSTDETSIRSNQANLTNNNDMQADQPLGEITPAKDATSMTNDPPKPTDMIETKNTNDIKIDNNTNDIKIDNQVTKGPMTLQTESKDAVTPTNPSETKLDDNKMKKDKTVPTTEVNQQVTPRDKINAKTTMSTHEVSTQASMRVNNTATRMDTQLFGLAVAIILHY